MAIQAAARRQRGKHGVAQSWKCSAAFAAVVQRVFLEDLGEAIACAGSNGCNPEVGSEAPRVTFDSLAPFRWSIAELANAGRNRGAHKRIGSEGIENIIAGLCSLGRTFVCQIKPGWDRSSRIERTIDRGGDRGGE